MAESKQVPAAASPPARRSRRAGEAEASEAAAEESRGRMQREAYRRIREMIIHQALAPGSLVSELTLSRDTALGRSPIRAALQRLAADGLVEILPQRGVRVGTVNATTELELLEVRRELERLLVSCAASRANAAQRRRMREIAAAFAALEGKGDGLVFIDLLRDAHEVLIEAAGNELLSSMMHRVYAISRRFWYARYRDRGPTRRGIALHVRRLSLVAEGDVAAAQKASDVLVAHIADTVRSFIEGAAPPAGNASAAAGEGPPTQ